jgi:hypothetical protein
VGDTWSDLGATVTDNVDQNLTATAVITDATGATVSSIDTSVAAVFTVTYSATDAANNTGTAVRTVTIQ